MAQGKESFLFYVDQGELFEELTDEQAGKLIKHTFRYVSDQNPEAPDQITKLLFIPIKQTLKRDLKKYEKYVSKQQANGKKGGRPKKEETQKTQAFLEKPKKADSVSVSVSDSVSVSVSSKDDDVYFNINELNKRYLSDDKLCKAVIDNNSIKDQQELAKRLESFHIHLKENGQTIKTWKDYTSHFLNWHRKTSKMIKNDSPTKNIAF
jgi:thiamine kinase-like enzyme